MAVSRVKNFLVGQQRTNITLPIIDERDQAEQRGYRKGVEDAGLIIARLVDLCHDSNSKGTAELLYHDALLPIRALATNRGEGRG